MPHPPTNKQKSSSAKMYGLLLAIVALSASASLHPASAASSRMMLENDEKTSSLSLASTVVSNSTKDWKYASTDYVRTILSDIPEEAEYLKLNNRFSPCPDGYNSDNVADQAEYPNGCGFSLDRTFDIFDVCADDGDEGYQSKGLQVESGCQKVFAMYPEVYDSNTPVVFVLHGNIRDAWNYLFGARSIWNGLRAQSLEASQGRYKLGDVIFIAPYYDKANFPLYTTGGVYRPSDGSIRPEEEWYFSWVSKSFDALKERQALDTDQYSIVGYSAGGQFSHRLLILGEVDERLYWTVTGAPSTWTFPNRTDVAYPYGLADAKLEGVRSRLSATFRRRHSVFVGEKDTIDSGVAAIHPEAAFQGRNRLERAAKFSIDAAYKSASLGSGYAWTFDTLPGAGHNDGSSDIWEALVFDQGFPFYPQWMGNNHWKEMIQAQ